MIERNKISYLHLGPILAAVCFSSSHLSAATPSIELTGTTGFSDNANKTAKNTAIDERQDIVGLNIKWEKRFDSNADVVLDYELEYEHFEEGSSDDELNINGDSSLNFTLASNLKAKLDHSIKQLLKDPGVAETNNNLEERNIYGAQLTADFSPSSKQTIFVTPSIQEIDYGSSSTQNSTRFGLTGTWQLNLSSNSYINAQYQTTKIDYDSNEPNQDYDQFLIGYGNTKRRLSYSADVGINRYSSDSRDSEEPYLALNAAYKDNTHQLSLDASRILTDTSFGDGNQSDLLSSIDGNRNELDQLLREKIKLSYSYYDLCRACTLKLGFEINDEQYLTSSVNDLKESIFSTGITYKWDSRTVINARFSHSGIAYKSQPSRDYDLEKTTVSFRKTIDRNWSWKLLTEYEARDSDATGESYSEIYAGISIGYLF
ncbi:MAG: hypothetical protein ACRBB4_04095 [Neptuniibacter sp.]